MNKNKKMYIGNLDFKASEEDLKELFSAHGEVQEVKLITDRDTGRPRGFGFVTMQTAEGATRAIENLDGKPFQGRNLVVNLAREEQRDRGPRSGAMHR